MIRAHRQLPIQVRPVGVRSYLEHDDVPVRESSRRLSDTECTAAWVHDEVRVCTAHPETPLSDYWYNGTRIHGARGRGACAAVGHREWRGV